MDIRIGKILECSVHPDAESLYVESIDLGEEGGPRTIVSGLVKFVPREELEGRQVVVLANLKPRNMRGIKSAGMLLCASNSEHTEVEPLLPPEGAQVGERVWFGDASEQAEAAQPNQVQKKKLWEAVQPFLWPFAAGFAVTGGIMFYIASLQTDAAIKESKFVNPRH
ncbi:hypothetical protein APUTEX25_005275 [Auxenochlorella protothecoides]|uniref:tRNA-binding domain-containing protein n=1 Tax=Auxenochlorella protothecoides TaxID=3075 RepID=A0A3M7KVY0_AUXPR|nr:hypothetical protein APUTEX25_005275 [Auxenochlorella protothecoides]|eukprot:RMZ53286.1 hypothetical protein APUTEX25_005275 [Auxenochlorella protothecoides]